MHQLIRFKAIMHCEHSLELTDQEPVTDEQLINTIRICWNLNKDCVVELISVTNQTVQEAIDYRIAMVQNTSDFETKEELQEEIEDVLREEFDEEAVNYYKAQLALD